VLDLGCSTGFISDELCQVGAKVTGVDIDEPGLDRARARFGDRIEFVNADGTSLPWADGSVDAVICNHVYEHVLHPDGVLAEVRRVLRPDGAVYLGLPNRLALVAPNYTLPTGAGLPPAAADRYVAATGRADRYHERLRTPAGLRRLCRGLRVWDYTGTVLAEPTRFHADDMVPRRLQSAPPAVWRALHPIIPTYIWVGTKGTDAPRGPVAKVAPKPVDGIPPA
jgi:SAM-dependent methyltransferase